MKRKSEAKKFVYREVEFPSKLSPFAVFRQILPYCQNAFLLESLGPYSDFSRFTYLGFNPAYHLIAREHKLKLNGGQQNYTNPYHALRETLAGLQNPPFKAKYFCGGLVGYFSYESSKYFEPAFVGSSHPKFPEFEMGLFLDGLKFDKQTGKFVYFYLRKDRRKYLLDLLARPGGTKPFNYRSLGSNKTVKQYKTMFHQAKEAITAGKVFQVVLSIKHHYQLSGSPLAIYQQLRTINPSPYMYYLKFGTRHIIGASPELLIRLKGNTLEHFGTLAGTIRRGKTIVKDKKLETLLQNNEKEKAEHMMLVDLARNDVGKICKFGRVKVKNLLAVKKFSHVQHLFTAITGELKENENAFTALAACFPAGTLTGAPKIEAMKLISQLEKDPRGPYGGVVGYFSFNGNCMFAINIRSIYVWRNKAYAQIGSGIVYDSTVEREYAEIKAKHEALRLALKKAESSHSTRQNNIAI